jgi:hypothetical protein
MSDDTKSLAWRLRHDPDQDDGNEAADELERLEDDAALLDWGDTTGHHDIRYSSLRDELRAEITAEAARAQGERT